MTSSCTSLGPLPPPAEVTQTSFGKSKGAKDLMRTTTQYQWRRKKQERERHSAFKLQAQKSLSKLKAADTKNGGLLSADVYDPPARARYICPGSFDDDPELAPMVRRVLDLKKLLGPTQGLSPADWDFSRTSHPNQTEVQDWISKTLASAPRLPEPEIKLPAPKPRRRARRRRSSIGQAEADKAIVERLTDGSGAPSEDWGVLSDTSEFLQRIKSGTLLSEDNVQSIQRLFDSHCDRDSKLIPKDLVHQVLEEFGIHSPDRQLLAKIINEVAPYSQQVDLTDLTDIIEKWLLREKDFMEETFKSMDKDSNGNVSVQELLHYLGAVGITPLRSRVKEVLDLVDRDRNGTLDFEEVVHLIFLYRQTEGFSLKEVRVLRGICAREANGEKGLPRFKLKDVLLLFFGPHCQQITEQLFKEAGAKDAQSLMPLSEVLLWARRQREQEIKVFRQKFQMIDSNHNERIELCELSKLVGYLGFTVGEATVQELLLESEDDLFGGRKDGVLDFDEFVNFMVKLQSREGFSIAEVKRFKEVFDRFDDNGNAEVEVLELADVMRYLGNNVKLDDLHILISQVDFNGSGALEFQEFLRLMRIHREEEVKQIQQIYNQFMDESMQAMPKAALPGAMSALGFSGDSVSLTKMRAKASGRRRSLQVEAAGRLEDAGDAISFEGFLQWVDDHRAVKVTEQRRCAAFSSAELDSFRLVFAELDAQGSGVLDIKQIGPLFEKLGLPSLTTAEARNTALSDLEKARSTAAECGVSDTGSKGEGVNFWVLVQLLRIQFSRDDGRVVEREAQAVSETSFSQAEVDSFRESFVSWFEHQVNASTTQSQEKATQRVKELTKETLGSLIRSLGVKVNEDHRKRLDRKIEELNPNSIIDFPDFLRLMRWMVTVDFGGINRG
mmetsp:Transcript_107314/g.256243  ORF Transcript_107314/g.256243 Transcript_107314/m.256243 type:complete len:896 (-) Transcript_107314:161-2848(-)